ncbi:MAG: imidazole glycerol phosphate synthase subunit HisH [Gemmatimonadaceae bacterium]|nr:imidazole glycerol phosphate synthase subunit HisH [Chitinophagaceae bacterium]
MNIAIVKYNAGNIQSVLYALERIGATADVTDDHDKIASADKVIFPGVGEASTAMNYLKERGLDTVIKNLHQPVLGICLGMQLMCSHSDENNTPCLGIFEGKVKWFGALNNDNEERIRKDNFKVPQIGWNNIFNLRTSLFTNVPENDFCYFVHGYYADSADETIATANYIIPYSAALNRNNFYGVQFHPEKSATTGEQILKNFLNI